MGQKAIFLDRDGVINVERGDYTFRTEDFHIIPGVKEAVRKFHKAGFLICVITNQAGISLGRYTVDQMKVCHDLMKAAIPEISAVYYCPYHPEVTKSLARKPSTLMFERAIARFRIDPDLSAMIGDRERDLIPARKLNMKTFMITSDQVNASVGQSVSSLQEVLNLMI